MLLIKTFCIATTGANYHRLLVLAQ